MTIEEQRIKLLEVQHEQWLIAPMTVEALKQIEICKQRCIDSLLAEAMSHTDEKRQNELRASIKAYSLIKLLVSDTKTFIKEITRPPTEKSQ